MKNMALDIRTFGDPVLKTRAAPVTSFDDSLAHLAEEMLATMREHEGVGLAANQVGRLKRILVATLEDEEFVVVIPDIQVEIERPTAVTVSGQDPSGRPLRIEASDMLARILQHEIDHLDGVLILDRTDRQSRRAAMREWRERLVAQKELTTPVDKL
jgi:peptide deformylase